MLKRCLAETLKAKDYRYHPDMVPSMRVVGQDGLHSLDELDELAETEDVEGEGAGAGAKESRGAASSSDSQQQPEVSSIFPYLAQ